MTAIANPAARRTAPRVTVQQITANDLVIRTPRVRDSHTPTPVRAGIPCNSVGEQQVRNHTT